VLYLCSHYKSLVFFLFADISHLGLLQRLMRDVYRNICVYTHYLRLFSNWAQDILCVLFIFHIYINNQYLGQIICTDRKVKRKCLQALNIIPAMNFCAATDTSRVLRSRRLQGTDAHVCVRDTRVSARIRRNKCARAHTYMIGRMNTHAHSRATRSETHGSRSDTLTGTGKDIVSRLTLENLWCGTRSCGDNTQ
jgi:hypothetical protein